MLHRCPYCHLMLPTQGERVAHLADPHACPARQTPVTRLAAVPAARPAARAAGALSAAGC